MVPETKKLLSMYLQNGSCVKTYLKLPRVGCAGNRFGLKVSPPGLNAAETIQTSGEMVAAVSAAVPAKETAFQNRRDPRGRSAASGRLLATSSGIVETTALGRNEKED